MNEVNRIGDQFMDALNSIIQFLPNLIGALLLLLLAWVIATVLKTIIVKGLKAANFDNWLRRKGLSNEDSGNQSLGLIDTLGKVAYFVTFILFLPPVFDMLNMNSVAEPIRDMMTSVLEFAPRVFVAAILLVLGIYIAKIVGQLLSNLLKNFNVDRFNSSINFGNNAQGFDIPTAAGWIVTFVIGLFFVVQAMNVLNLEVLNDVGSAIIAYIPLVVSAAIILTLGLIGGNLLSTAIYKATGNGFVSELAKYLIIIVAIFMTLDQLNFAQNIVNLAFLFILGGLAIAFAISFGLGGKSFAEKQLSKFEERIEKNDR